MMDRYKAALFTGSILFLCMTQPGFAATAGGHAFKFGETDHSGITISLETLPQLPATGWWSLALLAVSIGVMIVGRKNLRAKQAAALLILMSCAFAAHAFALYTTTTDASGAWSLNDVTAGEYRLDATADGFYPEEIEHVIINEGSNELPDIWLYPIGTPTPGATATDTPTPEPTPTVTGTPEPTATDTPSVPGAIIIDHTSVDLYDDIPEVYMAMIKTMWLNLPGESHASGYRKGVTFLYNQDSNYPVVVTESAPPEPYRTDALRVSGLNRNQYNNWDTGAGEAKWYANPSLRSRLINHLTYCNTNNLEIAAMGFGWCWDMTWHNGPGGTVDPVYAVRWAGSSEGGPEGDLRWGLDAEDYALTGNTVCMDTYLAATEEYIAHCVLNGYATQVIFTTGPVDGYSGESGAQRHIKHQYMRSYVLTNNRVLLDYADILAFNDAGEENLQSWNGIDYQMIHSDNMQDFVPPYEEDGDHIGEVGALRLGKALWVLMARIAGWDGIP